MNGDLPRPSPGEDPGIVAEIYEQLKAAARVQVSRERANHTLSATALVHEAWLRLAPPRAIPFERRAHFYSAAVQAMRHVLLDHAKARGRAKRGSGRVPVDLDTPVDLGSTDRFQDYLLVDEAIDELARQDARAAQIVRLRFFAGLSVAETAALLETSERTVKGDWAFARAWLTRSLRDGD